MPSAVGGLLAGGMPISSSWAAITAGIGKTLQCYGARGAVDWAAAVLATRQAASPGPS